MLNGRMRPGWLPTDPAARRAVLAGGAVALVMLLALVLRVLDAWSLLVTLGGALAVTRVTFPRERLAGAVQHVRAALAEERDPELLIVACKRLARVHRLDGAPALERAAAHERDPFLARAIALGIDQDDVDAVTRVLCIEAERETAEIEASRQVLVTMGKLFPAFGLIGTLFGLALLLRNLSGADLASIAPGLGLAVQTTLYGAVLANAVALPLATRLHGHAVRRARRLQMTIDGAALVLRGEYPSQIDRTLRAHLAAVAPSRSTSHVGPIRLTERAA